MNQSDGKPVCNKCLAFIALEGDLLSQPPSLQPPCLRQLCVVERAKSLGKRVHPRGGGEGRKETF